MNDRLAKRDFESERDFNMVCSSVLFSPSSHIGTVMTYNTMHITPYHRTSMMACHLRSSCLIIVADASRTLRVLDILLKFELIQSYA